MQFSQKTSFISIDKCLNTISFPHLHSPRHNDSPARAELQGRVGHEKDSILLVITSAAVVNPIIATGNTTLC